MPELLTWPYPPDFVGAQSDADGQPESCVVTLEPSVENMGALAAFVPENRQCRVAFHGESARDISWSELRSLRLRRPLTIRRQQGAAAPVAPAQKCVVTFKDNGTLSAETVGFVDINGGLFIFIPLGPDTVERYFFPQHAVRHYQVGEHVGEVLTENKVVSRQNIEPRITAEQNLTLQTTGEFPVAGKPIGRDQVKVALKNQQSKSMLKVGEALRELDLITEAQLQEALKRQMGTRKLQLGHILVEMGFIDKDGLKRALAQKLGIPFIDLANITVAPTAAKLVEEEFVRNRLALPLFIEDGTLIVAMDDPFNAETLNLLSIKTRMKVVPVTSQRETIIAAIKRYYEKSATSWY